MWEWPGKGPRKGQLLSISNGRSKDMRTRTKEEEVEVDEEKERSRRD